MAASTAPLWFPAMCTAVGSVVPVVGNLGGGVAGMVGSGVMSGGLQALSGALQSGVLDQVAGQLCGPIMGGGGGGAAAPAGAGGADKKKGGGFKAENGSQAEGAKLVDEKDSESTFQSKLTMQTQQLTKMYEMLSNMMKGFHDTQMASVRNMR